MKGSRGQKRFITKHRDYLKAIHFDNLDVILKFPNCKKWYKRKKAMKRKDYANDVDC